MELVSKNTLFGGTQSVFKHASDVCKCDMTFAVYLPPQAADHSVPVLWYLSGLTCTHENAMTKAGLQKYAADHGVAIVYPDTSPRGEDVANDDAYDLGQGAGFYVNATQAPWADHFQMYDYITKELRTIIQDTFPVTDKHGITGHSMGGHGALTLALRNPDLFTSVSAFAPIVNPTASDWGQKQLEAYIGSKTDENKSNWDNYDATFLVESVGWKGEILIDQGLDDQFIDLLKPESFAQAAAKARVAATLRLHHGYDHSYFFVWSFAQDHMAWHAERLNA